jgi:hypothetical protein
VSLLPEAPDEQKGPVEADAKVSEPAGPRPLWRWRRAVVATLVFLGLWILGITFIDVEGIGSALLVLLVPLWLVTAAIVARPKKESQDGKGFFGRIGWQTKLVGVIAAFILIYLPFTFISDKIIPYAPLVEYALFSLALFILYRLMARSVGVAASGEALPPAHHRTHKQVIGAIDDPHFQKTVLLSFAFVERGKGARTLIHRLDSVMAVNGIPDERRSEILSPLDTGGRGFFLVMTAAGRARRKKAQERRAMALRSVFTQFNKALEIEA